jgi:hypothetical protein
MISYFLNFQKGSEKKLKEQNSHNHIGR